MVELVYLTLLLIFTGYFYFNDRKKLTDVGIYSKKITVSLTPYVLAIMLTASIVNAYISKDSIALVLGENNGILSPIVAALFGSFFEGPTVIAFVLGASLLLNGASTAAVGAFISSFSMVGLVAISLEKKELGSIFTITRFIMTLTMAVVIGCIMGVVI